MSPNMLTAYLIGHYPTLHATRTSAMHYALFGYGTAIYWVNGELVPHELNGEPVEFASFDELKAKAVAKLAKYDDKEHDYMHEGERILIRTRVNNLEHMLQLDDIRKLFDRDVYTGGYNWSKYSPIFNVPEDVSRDWAIEIKRFCDNFFYFCNMFHFMKLKENFTRKITEAGTLGNCYRVMEYDPEAAARLAERIIAEIREEEKNLLTKPKG